MSRLQEAKEILQSVSTIVRVCGSAVSLRANGDAAIRAVGELCEVVERLLTAEQVERICNGTLKTKKKRSKKS